MATGGDAACAMEVSSHALELRRADAVHWAVAVFTNLTQDHLDFHPDMEAYFQAKRRLFLADPQVRVLNTGDPYGRRLAEEFPDAVTYDVAAVEGLELGFAGARFVADGLELRTPLPGAFNVANCLAAVAAARALGVDDATIAATLPGVGRVPGRFEPVDEGQGFAVLVDYAHTPDSLDNVLRAARELAAGGRVLCVFGCGGDRDRGKRPLMGAIADRLADVPIVTSDNPRSEDPEAIVREVLAAMDPRRSGTWTGARRSHGGHARAAGRRARHRGQGPRAGPGARRRRQGAVRRRRRGARGAARGGAARA
jgi:UDP-N-acetylmuramoyl-L-alanyl-D-glutamate--2,6-diaminopimelate ligase